MIELIKKNKLWVNIAIICFTLLVIAIMLIIGIEHIFKDNFLLSAKINNYIILFTVIAELSLLLRVDKNFLNSIKNDFLDFFHNNKWWWIAVIFISILSYGFTLVNYSVGVDDEIIGSYMNGGLLSQGRFGTSHFLRFIFDAFQFLPFWLDFLGITIMILSVILWSIFFIRMSYGKLNKNYTIIFSCLALSYPVIAYLFIFMGNAYEIGFTFLFTSFALLLFSSWFYDDKKSNIINSQESFFKIIATVIIIAVSIGILEWTAVLFLTGIFSGLLIRYISSDKDNRNISLNELVSVFLRVITILVSAVFLNKILSILFQLINHIKPSGYTSHYVLWRVDSFFYQIWPFLKNLYITFFSDFISGRPVVLWISIFIYSIIINFLVSIFFSIKNKTIVPMLIFMLITFSAFSLNIITGNPNLEFRTFVHLAIPVGCSFVIFVYAAFKLKITKEKVDNFLSKYVFSCIRVCTIIIVILVVLYQTKELSRSFYYEYLRYESDVRTSYDIIYTIEKQDGSIKKPVVFVGPFKSDANIRMGYIVFEHDRWNIPENMFYSNRIIGFIEQLGYHMTAVSSQADLDKARELSQKMPDYPYEGSIHVFDNFTIVKFGEVKN